MKKMKQTLVVSLLLIGNCAFAQTGIIKGSVVDEKGNPIPFAVAAIEEGDKIITSTNTDMNGDFTFKNVVPGRYNVKVVNTGFNTFVIPNVEADPNQIAYVNVKLTPTIKDLPPIIVYGGTWEKSTINPTYTTGAYINIEQIEQTAAPKGDIIGLAVALTPAVMPTNDGKDLIMRGTRRGATSYIVDGNRTMDVPNVPGMGIANMEILTGGIPAEFGDVTGGVVIITTKDYNWEMAKSRIKQQKQKDDEE